MTPDVKPQPFSPPSLASNTIGEKKTSLFFLSSSRSKQTKPNPILFFHRSADKQRLCGLFYTYLPKLRVNRVSAKGVQPVLKSLKVRCSSSPVSGTLRCELVIRLELPPQEPTKASLNLCNFNSQLQQEQSRALPPEPR